MKSVTEFTNFTLLNAVKAKTALATEGKSPEEIQASLGTTFKMEGDKLKYFCNAVDVAEKNTDKLKRVLVISLGEGEAAPAKAVQVEEMCYLPEFIVDTKFQPPQKADAKGGRNNRGGGAGGGKGGGGPKGSPWGLSPEEKALKNKGGAQKPKA